MILQKEFTITFSVTAKKGSDQEMINSLFRSFEDEIRRTKIGKPQGVLRVTSITRPTDPSAESFKGGVRRFLERLG